MPQLQKDVLSTLAYTDQFDYPLTSREVYQRLIRNKPTTQQKVQNSLNKLARLKSVSERGDQYCLKGSEKNFAVRKKREKISQKKHQQVRKAVKILRRIPWISAIFVTGSLAMNNSTDRGDIDFMIVTQPNRLWLTRPLAVLISMLLGKKRSRLTEEPNSWCFNLWMTTNSLTIQADRRSVFTAYEVCQARCVFDRGQTHLKFMKQNSWIKQLLPNYYAKQISSLKKTSTGTSPKQVIFWKGLDLLLYSLQTIYMKPHQTRELVNRQLAFFHPRNTKKIIYKNWKKSTPPHTASKPD